MIRQIETEINRFNDILYIIQMLKDQSFRETHWNVRKTPDIFHNILFDLSQNLLSEIYPKQKKIDHTKITLSELLSANLVKFNALIYKISIVKLTII